jgi:hypothetical protein
MGSREFQEGHDQQREPKLHDSSEPLTGFRMRQIFCGP